MGYIGPANTDQFKSMSTQTITGDGSATTFTLSTPVANSSEIRFVVNIGAAVASQTPSTGSVDHTAISSSFNGMYLNLATVTSTVTITSAQNAFLAGPVNFTNTVTVEGTLTVI